MCRERGYPVYRGSLFDVLDRYYQAARCLRADVVVRLTADCPVIDPDVIDHTVRALFGTQDKQVPRGELLKYHRRFAIPDPGVDFAANRLPPPWKRTYPIGLDTEVCTFAGLERAWKEAVLPYEREHVMPFFYDQPERFRTTAG